MKVINFWVLIFWGFSSGFLIAHIKKEEGLFYKYVRFVSSQGKKDILEKKLDGVTESPVVLINGVLEFNQVVVAQSHQKPVVIKLFEQKIEHEDKYIYQDVAESLKNEVSFVAMNVFENAENNDIFKQIMAALKLTQADLPFFLFYKNGELYFPSLQGYVNKEYLENAIKRTFAL